MRNSPGHDPGPFIYIGQSSLSLTFVGIALFSPKEAHCCIILDFLRAVDNPDDLLKSTNSSLAKHSMSDNFFQFALARIPIAVPLRPDWLDSAN